MAENATKGGSYTRNEDGSLTLVERTKQPEAKTKAPAATPAKRTTREKE
ncbi:hypothetical protein RHAB21_00720 [Pseudorhizobium halotolerans]|uniref:Uncharacterized protein n=1 Tax=Pseudorhizobium halotolerans TaxID=1233081 RepID=A0ABM8PYX6_9HYPH|nr:hypothetical protein [Pseudorhizobium halotolerans]CAD7055449.1 hypothetical protein RHAB21_00720 [Pseudorhizobium halotolerans]